MRFEQMFQQGLKKNMRRKMYFIGGYFECQQGLMFEDNPCQWQLMFPHQLEIGLGRSTMQPDRKQGSLYDTRKARSRSL